MNDCDTCRFLENEIFMGARVIMRLDPKPWRDVDKRYLRDCKAELKRLRAVLKSHMEQVHQPELMDCPE